MVSQRFRLQPWLDRSDQSIESASHSFPDYDLQLNSWKQSTEYLKQFVVQNEIRNKRKEDDFWKKAETYSVATWLSWQRATRKTHVDVSYEPPIKRKRVHVSFEETCAKFSQLEF